MESVIDIVRESERELVRVEREWEKVKESERVREDR